MITDDKLHLTWNNSQSSQVFADTGGLSANMIDLGAADRMNLGNGEDLYAVWSLSGQPSGVATSLTFSLVGSTTQSGGNVSGTEVTIGTSRAFTLTELGCNSIISTTLDNTTETFSAASHGLTDGTAVYLTAAALPTNGDGITDWRNKALYVRDAASGTFKLSQTVGGAAINFTSNGTTVGVRRVNFDFVSGATSLAQVAVCLNPDLINKGYRYLQGRLTITGGLANSSAVTATGVITTVPPAQQRWLSYPTSILAV
jgi:hypothetical protein